MTGSSSPADRRLTPRWRPGIAAWELAQRLLALVGLVVLSPVLLLLALWVRLGSPGPALYRARRYRPGGAVTLYKLRSMGVGAAGAGAGVTAAGDGRVVGPGRFLRRTKLDELPQLWNVLRGDILLVGPRPEDPRYVDESDPVHRRVFGAKPGITGAAALAYRDEENLLAAASGRIATQEGRGDATAADVERAYREIILPEKLALEEAYLRTRSVRGDLALLGRTIGQVLVRTTRG